MQKRIEFLFDSVSVKGVVDGYNERRADQPTDFFFDFLKVDDEVEGEERVGWMGSGVWGI